MPDSTKRTELLCTKVTERMSIDFMREAAKQDRSVSELMYLLVREKLYGCMVQHNPDDSQSTK